MIIRMQSVMLITTAFVMRSSHLSEPGFLRKSHLPEKARQSCVGNAAAEKPLSLMASVQMPFNDICRGLLRVV